MGSSFSQAPAKREIKWYNEFADKLPSMEGKVVVITGTTSGTGFIASQTMANKGATLVLLNRKSERSKAALEKLTEQYPEAKIEQIECDLQDFSSVKNAADEIKSKYGDGIDVLCNNAGVMALEDNATKDGYDVQMQTNHLSHFLLTKELYPLLNKTAEEKGEARVVNHSSGARNHPAGLLEAKYLGKNGGSLGGNGNSMIFGGARWKRYQQTKLANSVFTQEMKKRCENAGSKVISLCAHPGLSSTNLQVTTNQGGGMNQTMFNKFFMSFSQSPEDGTMGILQGMAGEGVKSGQLWGPKGITGPAVIEGPGKLTWKSDGSMLWEESEKACGKFEI